MAGAVRRALVAGGWTSAAEPAFLGFVALLGFGALFVGVVKLAEPSFGAGRSAIWALNRILLAALASLGVPLRQGLTQSSIVPLGALLAVGAVIVWSARRVVEGGSSAHLEDRLVHGAKVGVPFGIMCFFAAVIFRPTEGVDMSANPIVAFVLGGIWGALFGAVGGALARSSPQAAARDAVAAVRSRSSMVYEGLAAAATMLAAVGVLAMVGALILIIVDLALGADARLTAGDAVAVLFSLVVFGPNIAVGVTGFAVGAPVEFVHHALTGGLEGQTSLLGLGTAGPEWYLYVLLAIPLVACFFGGYVARRRANEADRVFEVIGLAAAVFAGVLALLVFIGTARVDQAFMVRGNLLAISPQPGVVMLLSFVWAAVFGFAGWKAAETHLDSSEEESLQTDGPSISANERGV
jgi:hypothetical protein